MKSKRILTLLVGLLLVVPALAWGQAAGDSVILESKTVAPGNHPGIATDTAAQVYQRVWITNVDSLTALTLALIKSSQSGGAYAILARPRNFNGMASRLTSTLAGSLVFNVSRYHSDPPDSFLLAGLFDPLDPATIEPPNATRKAFWEIKYDSVQPALGQIRLDTGIVIQRTVFTNTQPVDKPVNFVVGILTVNIPAVGNPPPGDNVNAGPNNCAEYDFDPPPGCPANFSVVSPPGATIGAGTGQFQWCGQCGGQFPVTIQNDCNGTVVSYTFTATFNPGPPTAVCPPNAQVQAGSVYNG
ncbi:MAG TPA: hypothetical protein VI546_00100, partial [candidate division Zixibacteria bacterium]|nr:hypothetical protein [candidate division Zixibacteria bacterium]